MTSGVSMATRASRAASARNCQVGGIGEVAAGRLGPLEQLLAEAREHQLRVALVETDHLGEGPRRGAGPRGQVGAEAVPELVQQRGELRRPDLVRAGQLDRVDDRRAAFAKPRDRAVKHGGGRRARGRGAVAPHAHPGAAKCTRITESAVIGSPLARSTRRCEPAQAGSSGSAAASTLSRSAAASATERASGPAVSWAGEIGTIPVRLTRPSVGLMPTTPHALAGQTIEPSVSVPTAMGPDPPRSPAAEPELEPDGLRSQRVAGWRSGRPAWTSRWCCART